MDKEPFQMLAALVVRDSREHNVRKLLKNVYVLQFINLSYVVTEFFQIFVKSNGRREVSELHTSQEESLFLSRICMEG